MYDRISARNRQRDTCAMRGRAAASARIAHLTDERPTRHVEPWRTQHLLIIGIAEVCLPDLHFAAVIGCEETRVIRNADADTPLHLRGVAASQLAKLKVASTRAPGSIRRTSGIGGTVGAGVGSARATCESVARVPAYSRNDGTPTAPAAWRRVSTAWRSPRSNTTRETVPVLRIR
jgi:hypothetical protein